MNTKAFFIFLILLLGLLLCSFLGSNYNKEGFDFSSSEKPLTNALNTRVNTSNNTNNYISNPVSSGFDNYNHYNSSGSSSKLQNGMIFTDASGDTVTVVINGNGTQSLQLLQSGKTTPIILSSTPPSSSNVSSAPNTFYAPFGNIDAIIITDNNGQIAVQFNLPNGQTIVFTQSGSNSNSITSTQYYGSTGYPVQSSGYSLAYQGPNDESAALNGNTYNPNYNGASATQYYGPNGESAGSVTGPNGNSVNYAQGRPPGSSNGYGNQYYSTMPQGISANQIPPGQEDLYILKTEIVPPVCPACPSSSACPRQEKCSPCPACARCPEPSFECKKVPNYNAIDNQYLPSPVLNDFSTFGM